MADLDRIRKPSRALPLIITIVPLLVVVLLTLFLGAQVAAAQDQPVIVVTGSDITEFPIVRISFIAVDGEGNRLEILPGLAVSEDGSNAEILDLRESLVGFEYIFVLDANQD